MKLGECMDSSKHSVPTPLQNMAKQSERVDQLAMPEPECAGGLPQPEAAPSLQTGGEPNEPQPPSDRADVEEPNISAGKALSRQVTLFATACAIRFYRCF